MSVCVKISAHLLSLAIFESFVEDVDFLMQLANSVFLLADHDLELLELAK